MSERRAELAALRGAARAYVEWEAQLSGQGIPAFTLPLQERTLAREAEPEPVAAPVAPPRVVPPPAFVPEARAPSPVQVPGAPPMPAPARAPTAPASAPGPVMPSAPSPSAAAAQPGDKRLRLAQLAEQARGCTRCGLGKGRTQTVFSRGDSDARLMFIGEGPGFEEDKAGFPFVGPAGKLLDKMVGAMGFDRDAVYVCNVVKCRPPGNRTPLPDEARACSPFLLGQLEAVRPDFIVALGRCASENLGLAAPGGGGWRGRWGRFQGIEVMPTYHPAFLLRSPQFKRDVWNDLQKVMARLKEGR